MRMAIYFYAKDFFRRQQWILIILNFIVGEETPKEVIDGKMKIKNRLAIRGVLFYQNKLLMIKTSKGDYKFPGGGKKNGENDFQTLNREYEEETGFANLINDENQIELI